MNTRSDGSSTEPAALMFPYINGYHERTPLSTVFCLHGVIYWDCKTILHMGGAWELCQLSSVQRKRTTHRLQAPKLQLMTCQENLEDCPIMAAFEVSVAPAPGLHGLLMMLCGKHKALWVSVLEKRHRNFVVRDLKGQISEESDE